ncbi:MAG: outer membrane lipoprotein chaperone LolA [Magnetococcales bacterium]|nr:outer membrane lipoprotein chaperone LolA [Magnetococcales bacterium]NGZ25327.1 outer membrane lipoprotein chaperone LolA [Magnetococcales bacterium]
MFLRFLLCALMFLSISAECGSDKPDRTLLQRLQKWVDQLNTLEADFVQQSIGSGASPQESTGHFSAARPGRFRWDYKTPHEQLIVSDGVVVWYYEPDLKQATRTSNDKIKETPAGFFTAGGSIEESFSWQVVGDSLWPGPTLRLTPKKEGAVKEIIMAMDREKDRLLGMEVVDSLGVRSQIIFDRWVQNKPISPERFNFDPPHGVDVVEDMGGR